MNLNLEGLHVVVTGGSRGIGSAIVEAFLREGCYVSFCSRNKEFIDKALKEFSFAESRVSGIELDVRDGKAFSQWLKTLQKIDIFIPNVSALSGSWDESIETDLRATVQNIEAALPYLEQSSHGALTYIASKAASFPIPDFAAYGAIKASMIHYMKSLSRKAAKKIRVNVVSPGDTLFPGGFWDNIRKNNPEIYNNVVESNPMGRLCTPAEVASVVVFLSSPVARYVSGCNWYVDGGATNHIQL